jgi:hypothetical protein
MPYPVSIDVQPAIEHRNRLTVALRLLLAIPHLILVGGIGFAFTSDDGRGVGGEYGLLGAVAAFLAVVSWFTLLIAGTQIEGIRQFTLFFLRWRLRALAYFMLLEDRYPPFGDAPYPTAISVAESLAPRDRLTVAVRLLLVIPHLVVLAFLQVAWILITIVAWVSILLTGRYPAGPADVSVGILRWRLRVEVYALLLVDAYPPFSLD